MMMMITIMIISGGDGDHDDAGHHDEHDDGDHHDLHGGGHF